MASGLVGFAGRRLLLGLVTLALLSLAVFAGGQVLPGDVGRAILGPLADPRAVAALDHQLGADRPAPILYLAWVGGLLRGDLGTSLAYRSPVAPLLGAALANSLKLALLAFLVVVPLGIGAGVYAALRVGRWQDRLVTVGGLSLTVIPEFVSSIVLILVFGVWLRWLPLSASARPGSGALVEFQHLVLPVLPLAFVLFGYIARLTRAGTLGALEADYTRTAVLKGLPRRVVLVRHVLRNALPPTIAAVAAQTGYVVGGLVVVESLFRYQGVGSLILTAAKGKDFPMLEAGVLAVGVLTIAATLVADALTLALDPRARESAGG
jgi:peptide/nickel transport system permease protein